MVGEELEWVECTKPKKGLMTCLLTFMDKKKKERYTVKEKVAHVKSDGIDVSTFASNGDITFGQFTDDIDYSMVELTEGQELFLFKRRK